MNPEEKQLLQKTYDLAEENNKILKGMRRMSRISGVFRVIYWSIIIIASVGAYYFIQPYVTSTLGLYDQIQSDIKGVSPR